MVTVNAEDTYYLKKWALDKKKGNALVTTSGHSSRRVAINTPDMFKPVTSQGSISIGVENSIQIFVRLKHLNHY